MPEVVKNASSLVSLSVIATGLVTSVSLTAIYFFGDGVMQARETRIEVPYIVKSVDHMTNELVLLNRKIDNTLSNSNDNRMSISQHEIRVKYCEDRLNICEINHRKYHHDMRK